MSKSELLAPNYHKLETALRSIGYTLEVAVADIIDNSIDAEASSVKLRLIFSTNGRLDLGIWDNGSGMSEDTLREAMRFGADVSRDVKRLGKFGLGLKLASLSQAKEVHVVTRRAGRLVGRAWLEDGIGKSFSSTVYDNRECRRLLSNTFPEYKQAGQGTLVLWSDLYRVGQTSNPEERAQKLIRRLEDHLSVAFHRFLRGKITRKLSISIDEFDQVASKVGIPRVLAPMDPFGYSASGHEDFPQALRADGKYRDQLRIRAHVWPPNSTSPEYKLRGGSNARQGFYFYRNNRLIQGGGWNGIREAEPHSSLARLEIDVDPDFDVSLSLDVKKVEIQLPPDFAAVLQHAKGSKGLDFKKYLAIANDAYRKRAVTTAELPLIPSTGLPAPLVDFLHDELRIERTRKHRDLAFSWETLDDDTFFVIERESGQLILNKTFRRSLLHGLQPSSADVPVLKCLLFLLLRTALTSERLGSRQRAEVELANRVLARAVRYEREG